MTRDEAVKTLKNFRAMQPQYIESMEELEVIPALSFTIEQLTEFMNAYVGSMLKLQSKFNITNKELS